MVKVVRGGSGLDTDAALVAAELLSLPGEIGEALDNRGVPIVACRNSVVDFAPRLSGVRPTNWPEGKTWDIVPGAYLTIEKAVVLATVERNGRRRVPGTDDGHGSASLAVHEAFHGYDFSDNDRPSKDRRFRSHWHADFDLLQVDYFRNADTGPGESYAESAARVYGLWPGLKDAWPNLRDYWLRPGAPDMGIAPITTPASSDNWPIGTGYLTADGSLHLFLVARSPEGDHGHAPIKVPLHRLERSNDWLKRISPRPEQIFDIHSLDGLYF